MAVFNLPEEMEMEILSRLPIESLMRFRCVSKQYRSLISDPYFVKFHSNRSILSKKCQKIFSSSLPPESIDFESLLDKKKMENDSNDGSNAVVKLDCPLWSEDSHVHVIGSCNGLICYVVDWLYIILYNPSTRVSKELPKAPLLEKAGRVRCSYGFAFDSSEDDYKVVFGTHNNGTISIMFHMFSLRHDSWRRIQDLSLSHLEIFSLYDFGVFLNGALHWLLIPEGDINFEPLHGVIVCFDLSKEVFSEMSLGVQGKTFLSFRPLGAFEECLYALSRPSNANGTFVEEVWLMKEYGMNASWTKFITIPSNVGLDPTPLCLLRDDELLLKIESGSGTELGSYHTKKKRFTRICNCPHSSEPVLYVESLVSPNRFDGNDKRPQPAGLGLIAVGLFMLWLMWLIFISFVFLLCRWMNVGS
ncbi:F-box/kelch-repeat protein At3g23880-like [Cornus florida]|uniref:F-box/kelch-repeat protein At3g23880-like n=1 Tax=Cornus florida TaxID=4283 RepID=UPI00289E5A8A|nr:F-box/kelch-repeat protein At3g23880-like [Cornus florida]XP_059626810.1 F-box/kelch-repeat protein At3g23880-like [Cornus florida]